MKNNLPHIQIEKAIFWSVPSATVKIARTDKKTEM